MGIEVRFLGVPVNFLSRGERGKGIHPAQLGLEIENIRAFKILHMSELEERSLIVRAIQPAILNKDLPKVV